MKIASIFLFSLFAVPSQIWAEEYTIKIESNGEKIGVVNLSINDGEAIADETERFDLKNERWQDNNSKQWATLEQCETWAKESKEKSGKSKVSIPERIRPFVEWSLNPTFNVKTTDTSLTMTSGQVDYEITGKKSERDLTNYYRYARLNAYKKAMTDRKLPPFAELKVLEELEQRKIMPTEIEIRIPGVDGAPTIKMVIEEK